MRLKLLSIYVYPPIALVVRGQPQNYIAAEKGRTLELDFELRQVLVTTHDPPRNGAAIFGIPIERVTRWEPAEGQWSQLEALLSGAKAKKK